MKKVLSMVLAMVLVLASSVAMAEMGVQVIGGQSGETQPVSLDDVQLEATIEIPGWGDITPLSSDVWDCVMVRKPGQLGTIWIYKYTGSDHPDGYNGKLYMHNLEVSCANHAVADYPYWVEDWVTHYQSNTQADFVFITMDILNTTASKVDYLKDCSVKVVFDDSIEYIGWFYQRNLDLNRCSWIDVTDNFAIDPYYTGHYVFGCTLPNAVFTSKKPLRMEIAIDGNEITYNIRK